VEHNFAQYPTHKCRTHAGYNLSIPFFFVSLPGFIKNTVFHTNYLHSAASFFEKIIKKFAAFYGTRRLIVAFKIAHHVSLS